MLFLNRQREEIEIGTNPLYYYVIEDIFVLIEVVFDSSYIVVACSRLCNYIVVNVIHS